MRVSSGSVLQSLSVVETLPYAPYSALSLYTLLQIRCSCFCFLRRRRGRALCICFHRFFYRSLSVDFSLLFVMLLFSVWFVSFMILLDLFRFECVEVWRRRFWVSVLTPHRLKHTSFSGIHPVPFLPLFGWNSWDQFSCTCINIASCWTFNTCTSWVIYGSICAHEISKYCFSYAEYCPLFNYF